MNTALDRNRKTNHLIFPSHACEDEGIPRLIAPSYSANGVNAPAFDNYITFIEQILRTILPNDLISTLSMEKDTEKVKKKIHALCNNLPLLVWSDPACTPCTLCVSLLCH